MQAYAINRVGPRYVWILPGWLNDDWWESENCSGCDWTHVLSQNVFLIDSYGEAREEEKNYSTPTNKVSLIKYSKCERINCVASIAQWLEHWSCKPGVGSSNLPGGLLFAFFLPSPFIRVY